MVPQRAVCEVSGALPVGRQGTTGTATQCFRPPAQRVRRVVNLRRRNTAQAAPPGSSPRVPACTPQTQLLIARDRSMDDHDRLQGHNRCTSDQTDQGANKVTDRYEGDDRRPRRALQTSAPLRRLMGAGWRSGHPPPGPLARRLTSRAAEGLIAENWHPHCRTPRPAVAIRWAALTARIMVLS